MRGEVLFESLGCVKCHIPSLPSSRGPVDAYTDLLIHDMGEELEDNIRLGDVSASLTDFRTQPLWGVSLFPPYLHDGRAATLIEAIDLHAGERRPFATRSRHSNPTNKPTSSPSWSTCDEALDLVDNPGRRRGC